MNCDIEPGDTNVSEFRNNLVYGGTFGYGPWTITNTIVTDNLFDHAIIPDWLGADGMTYAGSHNAYVTNCNRLDPICTNDMVLSNSPAYQTSWFGRYYLPPGSSLINAGSTTADQVGLYHFTTQTNQTLETNSIVDIGFHYVATDAFGNPLDANGNGSPDYLEDVSELGLSGPQILITVTTPTPGVLYLEPANIPIQASVTDWSGVITNVSFMVGTNQVTGFTNAPYIYTWPVVAAGSYSLTAAAQDQLGQTATSTAVSITVTNTCGSH